MTGKETTTLAMSTKKMRSGDAPRTFFYLAVSVSSRGVSPAAHHLSLPLGSSFSSSVFRVYSPPSTSAFHLRLPPPATSFLPVYLPSFLPLLLSPKYLGFGYCFHITCYPLPPIPDFQSVLLPLKVEQRRRREGQPLPVD